MAQFFGYHYLQFRSPDFAEFIIGPAHRVRLAPAIGPARGRTRWAGQRPDPVGRPDGRLQPDPVAQSGLHPTL